MQTKNAFMYIQIHTKIILRQYIRYNLFRYVKIDGLASVEYLVEAHRFFSCQYDRDNTIVHTFFFYF